MPHATDFEDEERATVPTTETPTLPDASDISDLLASQHLSHNHEPREVQAQLYYLSPSVDYSTNPPIQVVTRSATTRDPHTTVKLSAGPHETIHDVRGREHEFTLEKNGFQFVRNAARFDDWESKDAIWAFYIDELKEVVSKAMGGAAGGVDEIIAFHEGKRGSNKEWRQSTDGQRTNPFARQVHVDQSERTIRKIVKEKTDLKGDWLLKGRVRQVNAWRPLYHPVYDCGLCVVDSATVIDDDLIECSRVREGDYGYLDTMGVVKYRPGREWYYKSLMDPDDVVMFMGYDSDCKSGKQHGTGFTPHSAFDIPNPPPGSPPRASIEVRFLIFTWPDEPLVIRPGLGMITTQAPPREVELYESHHTENMEIEGRAQDVVRLADEQGGEVKIDLNEYDPIEPDMLSPRRGSIISSSSSPPPLDHPLSRSLSNSLEQELTEDQLVSLAHQRVADLQKQLQDLQKRLQAAEKTKAMVQSPIARRQMTKMLNERRSDELGRQRLEMARRIRGSFSDGDVFFDL